MTGDPEIYIYDFELDEDNQNHMLEAHGVYAEDLYEVLDSTQARALCVTKAFTRNADRTQ